MTKIEITFDEWYEDMYDPIDEITIKDVKFVRATCGDIQFHGPVFGIDEKDAKALLFLRVMRALND